MVARMSFLSTLHTTMTLQTSKTPNKTKLVDLGTVYDDIKKLADSVDMPVSTVTRLILRHTLAKGGSIGFVPQTNIPSLANYPAQGSSAPLNVSGTAAVLR